jgi:hypothetical protein
MWNREQRQPYLVLWALALAFGWIEAAVVIDLRDISLQEVNYVAGFQFPLVSIPAPLLSVEVVREACSLVVLGAVGWLVGRRRADRIGVPHSSAVGSARVGARDNRRNIRRRGQLFVLDRGAATTLWLEGRHYSARVRIPDPRSVHG